MPLNSTEQIASIIWDDKGQPLSAVFGDVYFSKDNGLNETRHVFLHHNHLSEKFSALEEQQTFIIGETGFGTGLNFLACWQLWQLKAPSSAHLHFISVEKFPLQKQDLRQALSLWPELDDLAQQLIKAYPPLPIQGFVRLNFSTTVSLTLIVDDALAGLSQLLIQSVAGPQLTADLQQQQLHQGGPGWFIDCWFLDGFAPAKNPHMWSAELFYTLARLSKPGTRFATFTAAALVKQGLSAAGFEWQKVPGYGHKRDMLKGELRAVCPIIPPVRRPPASWHLARMPASPPTHIAIIGAGIAGCHSARALAEKGCKVSVFERGKIAQGGSGNSQGVVYAKLSHNPEAFADFNLAALVFACQYYQQRQYFKKCGRQTGVLQLADNAKNLTQYLAIAERYQNNPDFVSWCSATQASDIAGVDLAHPGLFFPSSGWLNPPQLCSELLNHPNIHVYENCQITQLTNGGHQWQLHWPVQYSQRKMEFSHVVLACADQAQQFAQTYYLASKPIRGQITEVEAHAQSRHLQCVVCSNHYIAPEQQGRHCLGASFNPKSANTDILVADEIANLQQVCSLSSAFNHFTVTNNRASLRCVTPDYLPIIGPVVKAEEFTTRFAYYRQNSKAVIDTVAPYHPNLYVNIGHGSRGLTYTPLCAELLSCLITGLPLPISQAVYLQLHSARFLVRDLARRKM